MEKITHCMSIKEPYVSLIVAKEKTIEWRSRKLISRPPQTIAIATSKAGAGDYLPGGHIVGVARISAVVPWRNTRDFFERCACLEDWEARARWGGYAMMISGFAACKPVPIRGNVGVYRTPEGFEPTYAESAEQLRRWWKDARIWGLTGPLNGDERALLEAMEQYGMGWRIDD